MKTIKTEKTMKTIKSFTSIRQSKVLDKILPIESADMCYRIVKYTYDGTPADYKPCCFVGTLESDIPCWSLDALLNVLEHPTLEEDTMDDGKIGWMVSVYHDYIRYDSTWHDNPIDACYEMITDLHEMKKL